MSEEIGTGSNEAAAAAANAAKQAFASEGTDITPETVAPESTQPTLSPEELSAATEPTAENLPGSDFWDEDKTATRQPSPEAPPSAAPEVESAKEQAAEAALKYRANGVDREVSLEEARKILASYDGNQKGYKLASQTQRQVKQLQKQIKDFSAVQDRLSKIESLKGDPAALIEAVTGESMSAIVAREVEKAQQYQLASPEDRAKMDFLDKQTELEARVARQEEQLRQREEALQNQANEGRKEALNEKLKSAMSEYYSPNADPVVDNDLREMVWRTSVAKVKGYHAEGYPVTDKLINAVFKKVSRSLGTHRNSNISQEVAKASAAKTAQATEKAQVASQQNYSPSKLPSTKGMNPLELFESLVRGKRA